MLLTVPGTRTVCTLQIIPYSTVTDTFPTKTNQLIKILVLHYASLSQFAQLSDVRPMGNRHFSSVDVKYNFRRDPIDINLKLQRTSLLMASKQNNGILRLTRSWYMVHPTAGGEFFFVSTMQYDGYVLHARLLVDTRSFCLTVPARQRRIFTRELLITFYIGFGKNLTLSLRRYWREHDIYKLNF